MNNIPSPRVDDAGIEQRLVQLGAQGPRLTRDMIEQAVANELYWQPPGTTLTVCVLMLKNGYTVTGEAACVSPINFNADIGRQLARAKAVDHIWPLEGYLLQQRLHENEGDGRAKIERIAKACHEVNRAYCQAMGDNSQVPWEDAPEWQRASARMGVDLHLSGDFGPEASHISWMKQKLEEGWRWGPVKDAEKKEHHCLVPFSELPREQQAKDFLFRAVVHSMKEA